MEKDLKTQVEELTIMVEKLSEELKVFQNSENVFDSRVTFRKPRSELGERIIN